MPTALIETRIVIATMGQSSEVVDQISKIEHSMQLSSFRLSCEVATSFDIV